jgi:hypothetical protein
MRKAPKTGMDNAKRNEELDAFDRRLDNRETGTVPSGT